MPDHYDDYYMTTMDGIIGRRPVKIKPPHGAVDLSQVKPKTWQYSYSNQQSQGALICQTNGFPTYYFPKTHDHHCAYSDRLWDWDRERMQRACDLAGGGDQVWAYRLPGLDDDELREFAKVALNLNETPLEVRVVHYYNVSSGYSCPVVEALVPKKSE